MQTAVRSVVLLVPWHEPPDITPRLVHLSLRTQSLSPAVVNLSFHSFLCAKVGAITCAIAVSFGHDSNDFLARPVISPISQLTLDASGHLDFAIADNPNFEITQRALIL